MLINSKTALSLSLALGLATMGLVGSANAQSRIAQPQSFTIQDDGNRDSNGLAPVNHNTQNVVSNSAASAYASATVAAPRSQRVAEPESFRIQDQGNRDSNGY